MTAGSGARLRLGGSGLLVFVCVVNTALVLATGRVTLRNFPNSGDEYADLVSATLFASGRLSAQSPEPRAAFDVLNVINNGRFYGKYPPGWPAVLAAGVRAGLPWIVAPVCGLLAILLTYRLARARFSRRVADLAVLLLLASPYFVFTSASYFPHALALVCAVLCLWGATGIPRVERSWRAAATFGAAGGLLFATRPYTSVAVVVPLGIWVLWDARRAGHLRSAVRSLALAVAAFAPFLILVLAYNHALTGHAWLSPTTLYNPADRPGLPPGSLSLRWGLTHNVILRLCRLVLWQPSAALLLALPPLLWRRRASELAPLVCVWLALFVLYAAYLWDPGNEYGPRYLYEGLGALVVMGAWVVDRWPAATRRLVVGLVVAGNLIGFVVVTRSEAREVAARALPFELAAAQGLRRAIVFMPPRGSGTMLGRDLIRNGVDFSQSVLFVRDLGPENQAVLARYAGRTAYRYHYDSATGRATLTPY